MKKKWWIIFACLGFLFWSWVALRLTHTLDFYSLPTKSNLPTFHPGEIVFTSRLKDPDYNRFICFKKIDKKYTTMFRCIGKPGDIIEIRDSRVYRNLKLLDEPYKNSDYIITESQLNHIRGYVERNKNDLQQFVDTTYQITLSNKELKTYHLKLTPVIAGKGVINDELYIDFKNAGYNEDNFGPIQVPDNCYFLLGDNRHDALDSRYLGFIKKEEIVSTVIYP